MWVTELIFFFFKRKTSYEMRISDWSSDVCSSDLEVISVIVSKGSTKATKKQQSLPSMALEQVGILEISVRGVARYEQVVKLLEPYRSLNTLSKTCEMWLKDRLDEELGQDTYQLTIQISQR